MDSNNLFSTKRSATKIIIIATFILLMLIPLAMIKNLIRERESTKNSVVTEIQSSYADSQTLFPPVFASEVVEKDSNKSSTITHTEECLTAEFKADVVTDVLHRSIYDVIIYTSTIDLTGKIAVTKNILNAKSNTFKLKIDDYKGLTDISQLQFGSKSYTLTRGSEFMSSVVELPDSLKVGDTIDYKLTLNIKGTNSLEVMPTAKETTLTVTSAYPHPSFQGTILPTHREVRTDGFEASWKVMDFNVNSDYDHIGVRFTDPANNYQQAERSAKYGMLIIILVFVAGLFVEYITHKEINYVQYIVIGLSLVLFYSLLIAFSEFIAFGLAYLTASAMTIIALTLYFRAILKSRSAYVLDGFITLVYGVNYTLLQMETFALLTGSIVLFILLCVVMYLTSSVKNNRQLPPTNTYDNEQ